MKTLHLAASGLFAIVLGLSGCTTYQTVGLGSTYNDVLAVAGNPTRVSTSGNKTFWNYPTGAQFTFENGCVSRFTNFSPPPQVQVRTVYATGPVLAPAPVVVGAPIVRVGGWGRWNTWGGWRGPAYWGGGWNRGWGYRGWGCGYGWRANAWRNNCW